MAIRYYRLFDLLNRRGNKKTDLYTIISSPTVAKLAKGDNVTTDIINKICSSLNVQPGDIMEYIPDEAEVPGAAASLPNESKKEKGQND